MKYSDVIKAGFILDKKEKYTFNDVKKILAKNKNLSINQARFICRCSATYHDTSWSKELSKNSDCLSDYLTIKRFN